MSKLCRRLFPSILETEGLMSKLLLDNFDTNHQLYDDIVNNNLEIKFKNYLNEANDLLNMPERMINDIKYTPKELFDMAGYILYDECRCEKDIQKFEKYYSNDEELCTFKGGRLNKCRVFFAVKKNIDEINRENFETPQRQDEYGTSVLSIQFTKDGTNTLSIKNRYNHTVNNPDATFSNNLDNIMPGLTDSFEKYYGIVQKFKNNKFELPGYIRGNDGKIYKYNYEIDNIHYCPNNVVIDNLKVKKFDKEKYIIIDYFILDLQNKKISLYDESLHDSFPQTIGNILKILVSKTENGKEINITPQIGNDIKITIDERNRIIGYENSNIEHIGNHFLFYNISLQRLDVPKLKSIVDYFLYYNCLLLEFNAPSLTCIGNLCLYHNMILERLYAPNLISIGNKFLSLNNKLIILIANNLQYVGDYFLNNNTVLTKFDTKNLKYFGKGFFDNNDVIRNQLNNNKSEKIFIKK